MNPDRAPLPVPAPLPPRWAPAAALLASTRVGRISGLGPRLVRDAQALADGGGPAAIRVALLRCCPHADLLDLLTGPPPAAAPPAAAPAAGPSAGARADGAGPAVVWEDVPAGPHPWPGGAAPEGVRERLAAAHLVLVAFDADGVVASAHRRDRGTGGAGEAGAGRRAAPGLAEPGAWGRLLAGLANPPLVRYLAVVARRPGAGAMSDLAGWLVPPVARATGTGRGRRPRVHAVALAEARAAAALEGPANRQPEGGRYGWSHPAASGGYDVASAVTAGGRAEQAASGGCDVTAAGRAESAASGGCDVTAAVTACGRAEQARTEWAGSGAYEVRTAVAAAVADLAQGGIAGQTYRRLLAAFTDTRLACRERDEAGPAPADTPAHLWDRLETAAAHNLATRALRTATPRRHKPPAAAGPHPPTPAASAVAPPRVPSAGSAASSERGDGGGAGEGNPPSRSQEHS